MVSEQGCRRPADSRILHRLFRCSLQRWGRIEEGRGLGQQCRGMAYPEFDNILALHPALLCSALQDRATCGPPTTLGSSEGVSHVVCECVLRMRSWRPAPL